jgi:hypothetical protein
MCTHAYCGIGVQAQAAATVAAAARGEWGVKEQLEQLLKLNRRRQLLERGLVGLRRYSV